MARNDEAVGTLPVEGHAAHRCWMIEVAERHKARCGLRLCTFRAIKRQFGIAKVRYSRLMKDTAQ